jgi:SHS2 domain-containing protein
MFDQLVDLSTVPSVIERSLVVEGLDPESLLVNWLNELLFIHEVHREAYHLCQVISISPQRLEAFLQGGPCERVQLAIKAATYHGLAVSRTGQGYEATVVFDV